MNFRLFEFTDEILLDPGLSPTDFAFKDRLDKLAKQFDSLNASNSQFSITVSANELNYVASIHCDKWLEETGLHMNLYAGASQPMLLQNSNTRLYRNLKVAKYRNYSGDVSGVIGEALFSLLLLKRFQLDEKDFSHFGATQTTGIFPDFGIHKISPELINSFDAAFLRGNSSTAPVDFTKIHLLPAEVKSMVNPDYQIIKQRLDKAVQQLRNYWTTRKIRSLQGNRGASIAFLVLRNPFTSAFDGVIMWMK